MKKINLMDIMESLNSDNMDDAQAALHEWFVEQGRQVQAQLSGQTQEVTEAGAQSFNVFAEFVWSGRDVIDPDHEEDDEDFDSMFHYEGIAKTFQANSAEEAKAMAQAEIDEWSDNPAFGVGELQDSHGWQGVSSGYNDGPENVEIYKVEPAATTEGVVDEAGSAKADLLAAKARHQAPAAPAAGPTGNPADDAAGWMQIAQSIISTFENAPTEDEMHAEDLGEIVDCARDAIPFFQQGDVIGGVKALCPSANAQDYLSGFEGMPENYEAFMFSTVYPQNESAEPTMESEDDLIAELSEAFNGLQTVSDKLQNQEGAQVGEQGKVPVNTKGTLPSKKGAARVGGDPVEIKGKGHTGHALEKAPKVQDVKVKGNVQNSKDDPKKVADKGDKSALLNKMDGSVNTQSPISGKGAKGLKK